MAPTTPTSPSFLRVAARLLAIAALASLVLGPGQATAAGDYNGDGRDDLSIASPAEAIAGADGVGHGAVNLLFGRKRRLWPADGLYLTQAVRGARETPESGDALRNGASGDFDGDGRDDLVLSAPDEHIAGFPGFDHGGLSVLYGKARRFGRKGRFFSRASRGMVGSPAVGDDFGRATASGDFNGDGRDDLAVSVDGELRGLPPMTGIQASGGVHVFYGGKRGLRSRSNELYTQLTEGLKEPQPGTNDNFGMHLAAGDFDGNGRDDLAISASGHDAGGVFDAGAVYVIYGKRQGLTTRGSQRLTQLDPRLDGDGPQSDDRFGGSLAAADFDGNGEDDLAIGAGGEDIDGEDASGAVHIVRGSQRGLRPARSQFVTPYDLGMEGGFRNPDFASEFGFALAAGRLDAGKKADLVVSAEPYWSGGEHGSAHVVFGSRHGLEFGSYQKLSQDHPDLFGDGPRPGDGFGWSLAIANLTGRGPSELIIGEPQLGSDELPCLGGGVHVLYPDKRRGLTARGVQFLTQDTSGLAGDGSEVCDQFGRYVG